MKINNDILNKIKLIISENLPKIEQEISETKELYDLMLKWSKSGALSAEEKQKVKEQIYDILRTIPALAIFLVPFGSIILIILIKYLPFQILPSSFIKEENQETDDSTEN